mgnify:CR=1 FL=1
MSSGRMPSRIHHTDNRDNRASDGAANGPPLSERIAAGSPYSWNSRRKLATVLAVVRYLADLNLPPATEAWLGAAFYTGLLGVAACALRASARRACVGHTRNTKFAPETHTRSDAGAAIPLTLAPIPPRT